MNILVIGKSGQLATELSKLSSEVSQITCVGRHEIDLANKASIEEVISNIQPDVVINASAYTAVDLAEKEVEQAEQLNGYSVGNLADACQSHAIHLIHISTDFVFDGTQSKPYLTEDKTSPINVYGASKVMGEEAVLKALPKNSCIIRTSWVYSTHGNNFVRTMLSLMESKPELGIISDQIGTPTYAKTLAEACIHAATQRSTGIYHWTDQGVASWYDFAVAIQTLALEKHMIKKNIPIKAIKTADYPTPAKRPHYSVLDKSKNNNTFPTSLIKHWRTQLDHMLDELQNRED